MNKFVFVVCGASEFIDELNYSLNFLRYFSKNEIIVITDASRNEIPIEHNNIIDIKTPLEFNNHQASIYLKTGIHKYLDLENNNYCYLDSDVVAISEEVDTIFNLYRYPIIFAQDHCTINFFSPHAMNCSCIENTQREEKKFNDNLVKLFGKINLNKIEIKKQFDDLQSYFDKLKSSPIKYFFQNIRYVLFRYVLPIKSFSLHGYKFVKKTKCWYNNSNEIILFDYPFYEQKLWEEAGIRYNTKGNYWEDKSGKKYDFFAECDHLISYLELNYNISIPYNWQHWNGGVFVFNKQSCDFLNYWHEQTIKEFSNKQTKTRDQGTLALTVWKFNLQDHPTLPKEFNWIAEYANSNIKYDKRKAYTFDNFKTNFKPKFIHIYHEWGNKSWSIWQSVEDLYKKISQ